MPSSNIDNELDFTCRRLLAHAPDPLFIVDVSSSAPPRLAGANAAWYKLLGSTDEASRAQPLERLLDEGGLARLASHLRQCLETGSGVTYTDVLSTPAGERHTETSLTPLCETGGPAGRVLGFVRDVTEQQRIREQYNLLEFALDQVQEAAYLLDEQARIRYVNRESGRMLGYSRDELLAMSVPDLDPDYPMDQWPAIWSKVKSLGALSFETRHRRKDGRIIPVEITSGYLQYQSRDYEFALVRDVSERKRTESELHARTEEFRALVENSPDLFIRYDRHCKRIYANPAFVRLTGLTLDTLLGNTPTEQVVLLAEPKPYEEKIRQVFENGMATEHTFSWHTLDGDEHWTHARFVPEWGADGAIATVLAICHDVTTLKKTESQLATLIDNIPDMVTRFDTAGRHCYVNPTVCKTFDQPESHFIGREPPGEAHDGRPLAAWIREVVETGQPNQCEATWQLPQGARHFSVRHVPETDRYGQVTGVLGIATDVTALKEAELQYRTLTENLPDVVVRYDLQCRRTYVNPAYERTTGCNAKEALGTSPEILWTPVTPPATAFMTHLRRVIDTGEADEITLQLLTPEGRPYYHAVSMAAERDAAGKIIGALSISRDISELIETQQALGDSEERYRQIFDNTQESLFLVEALAQGGFRILEANPRFEETIGHSAGDLIGKTLEEALPEPIAAALNARYRRCVEDGAIVEEEMALDPGKGVRTFHSTLIPVKNKAGLTRRIVGLMRDITERLQSETAMQRLNRTLKTLSSGNAVLVRATSEAELLEQMCKVVVDVGGYQLAWIGFAQAEGRIEVVTSAGIDADLVTAMDPMHRQGRHAENPAHAATRTGEVQIVRDKDPVPADTTIPGEPACLGFRACLALPLKIADNEPGVLAIYSQESTAFDSDEQQLLTEMAKNLAYGIHALRVRIERENFVQRLQESIEATIQALASTVELRDPYTAGHQHRVAELAKAVARELGMPEVQIQVIYLAGMVHDIGKIAIPAEILSKPGRLSEAELILVRTHAEAGYDILKTIEFPWPIAQIVRQHHERLNGSGYPQGLHKDEILVEARILAVCDVVEAMTTHRPYRPGLGIEAALDEIQNGRHELYDARVVDSCLRVIRDLGFRFQ